MTDELLNALKLIKEECSTHERCNECPMIDPNNHCGVCRKFPSEWSLKVREVYFNG